MKCRWRCIVGFWNYSFWTKSDPKWTTFLLVLFYLAVCCELKKASFNVVLNVQVSISSRWSTRGTALCGLFSILRRTSPWFLPSLMAARGNIQAQVEAFHFFLFHFLLHLHHTCHSKAGFFMPDFAVQPANDFWATWLHFFSCWKVVLSVKIIIILSPNVCSCLLPVITDKAQHYFISYFIYGLFEGQIQYTWTNWDQLNNAVPPLFECVSDQTVRTKP